MNALTLLWPKATTACLLFLLATLFPVLAAPVKIACVGDSITQGSGLGNPATESYPAKLGKLLGTNYLVQNYGVSGRTLLKKGDYPYWKESAYTNSHKAEPDIVLIMLGTNDSKPQNWRYGTNFLVDYEELMNSYTSLPSHPRLLLCVPCPVFGNGAFTINPGIVRTNISPIVRDLGARLGHDVLDLQVLLAGHAEWFPDTVHPNTRGTTVMAALLRTALVESPPAPPAPSLQIYQPVPNRVALSWTADWGGLVLQSTTALNPLKPVWTVVEQVAVNDGATIRVTNTLSPRIRFYRLWQP